MSGALKSGLIFGVVGLVIVLLTTFVPPPGPVVCGPLVAVIVGAVAGFYGVRWSAPGARIGRGVLAGVLAGLGMLIGAVIAYTLLFNRINSDPLVRQQLLELLNQQPNAQIDPAALPLFVGIAGVIAGLCVGVLNLVLALAFGALGGWIGTRNQPVPEPTAPPS